MPSTLTEFTAQRKRPRRGNCEPVAIVGLAFQFPGGCDTTSEFWQALLEKRNTSTEAPKNRYSAESLFHPDGSRRGTVGHRGGHFLKHDISRFDAPFFNISATEAAALDPQQRGLLETAYRALENAGQVLDQVIGSNTSVFTGCFSDDYKMLSMKDAEQCPSHTSLGITSSMLANRLSWFFNFKGASCNLDSACSSSLMAVDLACKGLANGDADMALAAGCNLLLYPDMIHGLSNLGLLSPDSQSYSFDSRANGYARADGFGVLVLKRLEDAIADNDVIRAVIRATGSNQDGYTPILTQPNGKAQAELIRTTYARAGLSLADTRYIEAHGTGTATGDPIEIDAIGSIFRTCRSTDEPLYVGAVKSNIGHSEGASGIAGIIKTVLILENGIIPPNANFLELNSKIDLDYLRIALPQEPVKWPSKGLRRASVNSFGFGGSNTHVIIDDAYHYLEARGLTGQHNTVTEHEFTPIAAIKSRAAEQPPSAPRLVVLTANDSSTLARQSNSHANYFERKLEHGQCRDSFLDDFTYTLNQRRSHFSWRSAAVVGSSSLQPRFESLLSEPQRSLEDPALCFVFTGQGAQYPGEQLRSLEHYDVFRQCMLESENYLKEFGCQWKLRDELYKPAKDSRIYQTELSQPLSTVLQIALIDLLRYFGIRANVVVGHSSGEIAAAYCVGALSKRSAIKIAYLRGRYSAQLAESGAYDGGMMATSLSAKDVRPYIDKVSSERDGSRLTIACVNSPNGVTVSGDKQQLDILEQTLSQKGIFTRRLNVEVAYHSPSMRAVSQAYHDAMGQLEVGDLPSCSAVMLSTVSKEWVPADLVRNPQYWVDNMVSPVQFSPVIENLTFETQRKLWKRLDCTHLNHPRTTYLLEIGFHGTLQGPLREILSTVPGGANIGYDSVLTRNRPPVETLMATMGKLFCHGCRVDLEKLNGSRTNATRPPRLLCDLPEYAFDHSKEYWEESRISKRYRLHPQGKLDFLGKPCPDWNKSEAKWRNFIRVAELPWVQDHKINGTMIYPGAGMLVMAIEAANQLAMPYGEVEGFELKDIRFISTLPIPCTTNGIETQLYLRELRDNSSSETPWLDFRLFYFDNDEWHENCRGSIRAQHKIPPRGDWWNDTEMENAKEVEAFRMREISIDKSNGQAFDGRALYSSLLESGYAFGPSFQRIRHGRSTNNQATAEIELYDWPAELFPQPHIVHPCSLDAILHLAVAATTNGGNDIVPTAVPSSFQKLWVSKDGLCSPRNKSVQASVWTTNSDIRGGEYSLSVLDTLRNRILVRGDALRMTVVSNNNNKTVHPSDTEQTCFHLHWKPDYDLITKGQVKTYCEEARPQPSISSTLPEELTFVVSALLSRVLKELSDPTLDVTNTHYLRYLDWAREQVSRYQTGSLRWAKPEWSGLLEDKEFLLQKSQNISNNSGLGKVFVDTGQQLSAILRGQVTNLDRLIQAFSIAMVQHQTCFAVLSRFLDVVKHKGRHRKMLELGHCPDARILSATELTDYANVEFMIIDDSIKNARRDGKDEKYDVVFSHNTVGCKADLHAVLSYCRGLLRPGGRLVLYECMNLPSILRAFVAGLGNSGWLDLKAQGTTSWSDALRRSGFSGVDEEFPDFEDPHWHEYSILISTATSGENGINGHLNGTNGIGVGSQSIIVSNLGSELTKDVARQLEVAIRGQPHIMTLSEAAQIDDKRNVSFIFIDEIDGTGLMNLSERDYRALQSILMACARSLWITKRGGHRSPNPTSGLADGLFRVLRSERPDNILATLGLEVQGHLSDHQINLIEDLLDDISHCNEPSAHDQEYIEVDGILHVPRVTEATNIARTILESTLPNRTALQSLKACPPVQLKIGSPGFLDTLEFVEDDKCANALEPDEIEIQVKAVGLNFRDVLVALGRLPGSDYGSEAAGVVTRVGSPDLGFITGDRVVVAAWSTFRTFVRVKAHNAFKIDDSMTFSEASTIPTQFITAWRAIHELAHLEAEESILIHTGAGGTGQAAIQVALHIGATIYATVGSESKKQLLMREYGIPERNIFNSRDTSFAKGIMRVTGGHGVDVILNSLAGDGLVASWECIAPYGRFIELGKRDILQNANLPMYMFRHNTSFICFDGFAFHQDKPKAFRQLFEKVMEMFRKGVLRPATPLNVYPISKVEDAFRALQDGKSAGKTVLEFGDDMNIKTVLPNKARRIMDGSATYVVAGGLGGLGRNVSRWLVDRGAKHLLLLSRSGGCTQKAQEFIKELKERGVVVQAPKCDVTNFKTLKQVVDDCNREMPPIKGCVQGSMVLRDSAFDKMSFEDWRLGTECKTIGSWNLHQVLPDNLQFFVMLSSASGVVGLHGQANYAAGNAYMDALAKYRVSKGLRAISLDLGALTDDGLLSEDPNFLKRVLSYGALTGISRTYFNAIMDYYCDPSLPVLAPEQSQPIIGLGTGEGGIIISRNPVFRNSSREPQSHSNPSTNSSSNENHDWKTIFAKPSENDIPSLVTAALIRRLSNTNPLLQGEVDLLQPIAAYGVDSLLAVELRSWISREFGADVALFEIQGGVGFEALGRIVASRSSFGKEKET